MPILRPLLAALAPLVAAAAAAQCESQWQYGDPLPTPIGVGLCGTTWDPDGAGPLPAVLVAGGTLQNDGGPSGVFAFDGSVWTRLGQVAGSATRLVVWNGQLIAAVQNPGPTVTTTIRRWDGTLWQPLGTADGPVRAMASFNGQLVVGGAFAAIGGTAAASVAAWNGTAWSPLGTGVVGTVLAMAVFQGALRVGGSITSAGGQAAGNLVVWNGSSWSIGPTFQGPVQAMAVRSSTSPATTWLFVGGSFTAYTIGGQTTAAARVARFDTSNVWSPVGSGVPNGCASLLVRNLGINNYELLAGLDDLAGAQRVWRFASGAWAPLGALAATALGSVRDLVNFGAPTLLVNDLQGAVQSWDGTAWQPVVGQGLPGVVQAVLPQATDVVIGGTFRKAGGVVVNGIARGSANAWSPLGAGVAGGTGVLALAAAADGAVIAAGDFTSAGGVPCSRIARWDGAAWSPLGPGLDGTVRAVRTLPGGDLVAAGDFLSAGGVACPRVARWNGQSWSALGAGVLVGADAPVHALEVLGNGDLVIGGEFSSVGPTAANRIAAWNGSAWYALGSGSASTVYALAAAPNGDLFAGGRFSGPGGLASRVGLWRAGAWSPVYSLLVTGTVRAMGVHPGGDLFVGGEGWNSDLVRFRAGLVEATLAVNGTEVRAVAFPAGDVAIGGRFDDVGGRLSVNYARFGSNCPATGTAYGNSCWGLSGPLVASTVTAPWLGGSYRVRASQFGPQGFGIWVFGYQPLAVPLAALAPGALPGCEALLTAFDSVVGVPSGGALEHTATVPVSAPLIGASFRMQAVQAEAQPGGFALSSSNGLLLTLGLLL